MDYFVYTIYDRVALEGGPLFQARNDGIGIRAFHNLLERDQVNPTDFRLYCVGKWNAETMVIEAFQAPREVFSPPSEVKGAPQALVGVGG